MKNLILAAVMTIGVQAFAHGTKAEQAADAIHAAAELFEQQPEDVQKQFESVTAVRAGHEQFVVTMTLADKTTQFTYDCMENESVDPVIWECSAR